MEFSGAIVNNFLNSRDFCDLYILRKQSWRHSRGGHRQRNSDGVLVLEENRVEDYSDENAAATS